MTVKLDRKGLPIDGKKTPDNLERKIMIYKLGGDVAGSPSTMMDISDLFMSEIEKGNLPVAVISALKSSYIKELIEKETGYIYADKSKLSVTDVLIDYKEIIETIQEKNGWNQTRARQEYIKLLEQIHNQVIGDLGLEDIVVQVPKDEAITVKKSQPKQRRHSPLPFLDILLSGPEVLDEGIFPLEGRVITGDLSSTDINILLYGPGQTTLDESFVQFASSFSNGTAHRSNSQSKDSGRYTYTHYTVERGNKLSFVISREIGRISKWIASHINEEHHLQTYDELTYRGDYMAAIMFSALLNKRLKQKKAKLREQFHDKEERKQHLKKLPSYSRPITGREAAIFTDDVYGNANILEPYADNPGLHTRLIFVNEFFKKGVTPVLAGFGGVYQKGDELRRTVLGRSGTDTSATRVKQSLNPITKGQDYGPMDVECVFIKDTSGCLTADPSKIPKGRSGGARTILYLPHDIGVAAGNIQGKSLEHLIPGGLDIKVMDYRDPDNFTIIGPKKGEDKIYLVLNPVAIYWMGIGNVSGADDETRCRQILKETGIKLKHVADETDPRYFITQRFNDTTRKRLAEKLSEAGYVLETAEKAYYISAAGRLGMKEVYKFNNLLEIHAGEEVIRLARYQRDRSLLTAIVTDKVDPINLTRRIHDKLVLRYMPIVVATEQCRQLPLFPDFV